MHCRYDIFGEVGAITHPHLHLEEGIGVENKLNPLRIGGLDNYDDNSMPSVYGSSDFMFLRQGTNFLFPDKIYGSVDILVRAKDAQSNGSKNTGVYRIQYLINKRDGSLSYAPIENIRFDNIIGNVLYVYDQVRSNNSTYYYFVSNSLGDINYNRYWNTRLKRGEEWRRYFKSERSRR